MVGLLRAVVVSLTLFSTLAAAIPAPKLSGKQKKHYKAAATFLRMRHPVAADFEPVQYYSHLLHEHRNGEAHAWELAQTEHNGAVFVTQDGHDKNFFVTTKIPSGS